MMKTSQVTCVWIRFNCDRQCQLVVFLCLWIEALFADLGRQFGCFVSINNRFEDKVSDCYVSLAYISIAIM